MRLAIQFIARLIGVLVLASGAGWPAAAQQNVWQEYSQRPDNHPNIPNVSYAGYHNGEIPLPAPTENLINVKAAPYNAKGDGVTDDTLAIRNALGAVGAGGGVVFFPAGTYLISGVIFVHQNGTILRGESRAGTVLRFTKSLNTGYAPNTNSAEQSQWSWSGGLVWFTPRSKMSYRANNDDVGGIMNESWNIGSELAAITSPAQRGERSLTVSNAQRLSAGQFVFVRLTNAADLSTLKHLTGGGDWAERYDWSPANSGAVLPDKLGFINWLVEIESVTGNRVTLKQPLRFDLRAAWSPKLMALGDTIRECGIENLTVTLARDYQWSFDSHHNKEPGWNGPWFNNAINCFVRAVTVIDADHALGVAASKNITFTDFKLDASGAARRAHHHGVTARNFAQDCLWENFQVATEAWHGLNVEAFSMGQVWSKGVLNYGTFDTHRRVPYECVRTEITLNNTGSRGGAADTGPIMGARLVNWNVNVTNNRNHMIGAAEIMPRGALVAVRGCPLNPPDSSAFGDSQCLIVAAGQTPEAANLPVNLYEAQKLLRLGQPVASVSAASFSGTVLASEAITAAFGTGLATATQAATALPLPTSLAGTSVTIKDSAGVERLAPLFFVAPGQINFQIPAGTATGATRVIVRSGDGALSSGAVQLGNVAPGLFSVNASGQGLAAALALRVKADGPLSYEPIARYDATQQRFVAVPVDLGPETEQVFLILYGTGLRFRSALAAVTCQTGGTDAPVLFAGAVDGLAGLDQINVRLARNLAGRGEVEIALTADGRAANAVRVNVK